MDRIYDINVRVKVDTDDWDQSEIVGTLQTILRRATDDYDFQFLDLEVVDWEDDDTRAAARRLQQSIAERAVDDSRVRLLGEVPF